MHILLTNDDGIYTSSIAAMYEQLCKIATVTVVAPAQGQSGASHSITLAPLTYDKIEITGKFTGYSVEGTPVDCVKLAIKEICSEPIDLVVSGINYGANAGMHVHYSGTVGAAMEGAFCGIPAIAVSTAYEKNMDFEKPCQYALKVIESILPLKGTEVVNINIPLLSKGKPKGVKVVLSVAASSAVTPAMAVAETPSIQKERQNKRIKDIFIGFIIGSFLIFSCFIVRFFYFKSCISE